VNRACLSTDPTIFSMVDGCHLCLLPSKMHDVNRDSAVPDLLCDVSKQQLAVSEGEGH